MDALALRRAHFPDTIAFHAPGFKRFQTTEFRPSIHPEFLSISLTGSHCALHCDHCDTLMLNGMLDFPRFPGSLFDLCRRLAAKGVRGVLVSGGSDRQGRVPLLPHLPDLARARRELGLSVSVHPGLPDEETCAALADVGLEAVMLDIIGAGETIRQVYHLDAGPEDYDLALARLEKHGLPAVPHIVIGLHYGRLLGEWKALEMIAAHPLRQLVLVVLNPLPGTPASAALPPPADEIGAFFELARRTLPAVPILLGCARPFALKDRLDRLAVDAGLNGIAYPAEGTVAYARSRGLEPVFSPACCGITLPNSGDRSHEL